MNGWREFDDASLSGEGFDADRYRVTRKRDMSKETKECPTCNIEMETKGKFHGNDNWLRLLLQCPKCKEVKIIKSWW